MESLAKLPKLESLTIGWTQCTDEVAKAINKRMPKCKVHRFEHLFPERIHGLIM